MSCTTRLISVSFPRRTARTPCLRADGAAGRGHRDVAGAETRGEAHAIAVGHAEALRSRPGSCPAAPGQRAIELGAAGHRSGVPVLQQTARAEPERILVVGLLRRRLVGTGTPPRASCRRICRSSRRRPCRARRRFHAVLIEAVLLGAVAEAPQRRQPLPVHPRTGQVRPWL